MFLYTTLFILNVERYLGIDHPILHRNKVAKRRLFKVTIRVLWFVDLVEAFVIVLDAAAGILMIAFTICLFLAILIFIYVKIFLIGRKAAACNLHSVSDPMRDTRQKMKTKLAKPCFIVVCCTFLCFFTYGCSQFAVETCFKAQFRWRCSIRVEHYNCTNGIDLQLCDIRLLAKRNVAKRGEKDFTPNVSLMYSQ